MTSEVKEKVGIRPSAWILSIVVTIITVVLMSFWNGFSAAQLGTHLWGFVTAGGGWPATEDIGFIMRDLWITWFVTLLIPPLIMSAVPRRLRFTKQEYTLLFSMVSVAALIPTGFGIWCFQTMHPAIVYVGGTTLERALVYQNPFFGPDVGNPTWTTGFFYGGQAVPWGVWVTPMLWVIAWFGLWYLTDLMSMTLFRRVWIDVEALPYPLASGVVKAINLATGSEGSKSKSSFLNKWLWSGFLIGFLTQAPMWAAPLIPGWKFTAMTFDFTPTTAVFLPWVGFVVNVNSAFIAAHYLIPLGILVSFVVFFFLMWYIFPPVLSAVGLTDPFPAGSNYSGPWWNINYYGAGWNQWGHISFGMCSVWFGAIVACVLWPIFAMRRYYIESFRALWKKVSPEVEEREPLPYRTLIILWVVVFILWIIVAQATTNFSPVIPFWYSIIAYVVFWFLSWGWGWARLRGEYGGGGGYGGANVYHHWLNLSGRWWFWCPGSPIKAYTGVLESPNTKAIASEHYIYEFYQWRGGLNMSPLTMESYKVASLTNTRSRYVFVGSIIGIFIGLIFGYIFNLQFIYTYGVLEKFSNSAFTSIGGTWMAGGYGISMWETPYEWYPSSPPATLWYFSLLGGIIVVALYIIRMKFPGFPLHPIAFAACGFVAGSVFWPAVFALVAKYLTIRIGGVRLYEEKGLPFAVGILLAYGLTYFVGTFLFVAQIL